MISSELIIFVRDFAIFYGIYLIVALSLNLEYGYAGVPNFGKVLAVAGGAFTVGFFPGRLIAWWFGLSQGLNYIDDNTLVVTRINELLAGNPGLGVLIFVVTLGVACAVGAVLGLIASYPAIRLREDYLAMCFLAMGEAIQVIGYNYRPLLKGSIGVIIPDPFKWAGGSRYVSVSIIIFGISVLIFFYLERLIRTPLGRMLRAIRDNDDAAESLGKAVTSIRMKTIVLASAIGAIGGALDAFKAGGIISTSYHRVSWTFWPWVIVVLGGAANNTGVAIGTLVFIATRRVIDFYKAQLGPFLPFSVVWLDYLFLGTMIILIQMYKPEGILREKPTPTINLDRVREALRSN